MSLQTVHLAASLALPTRLPTSRTCIGSLLCAPSNSEWSRSAHLRQLLASHLWVHRAFALSGHAPDLPPLSLRDTASTRHTRLGGHGRTALLRMSSCFGSAALVQLSGWRREQFHGAVYWTPRAALLAAVCEGSSQKALSMTTSQVRRLGISQPVLAARRASWDTGSSTT